MLAEITGKNWPVLPHQRTRRRGKCPGKSRVGQTNPVRCIYTKDGTIWARFPKDTTDADFHGKPNGEKAGHRLTAADFMCFAPILDPAVIDRNDLRPFDLRQMYSRLTSTLAWLSPSCLLAAIFAC